MDLSKLERQLVADALRTNLSAKKPDDPLAGLTPEEAEKKAEEILNGALEAEKKIAELKAELAPVLKLASTLGSSRRFQQMVKAADAELVAIGALLTRVQEVEGYWRTGTQDQLIKAILATNPELEQLVMDAKEKAKTFNQGFSKVQVWDKQPEDKRKKAPYEVKLAADKVAALDKEAGIWDVLKKALGGIKKLTEEGIQWARSLFTSLYENHFENVTDTLKNVRRDLEKAVNAAT